MKAYEYLANAIHAGDQEVLEAARVKIRNELSMQCSTKEQFNNAWDTITRKALSRCRGSKPVLVGSIQDSIYDQEQRRLQGQVVRVPKIVKTQSKIYEPEHEIVEVKQESTHGLGSVVGAIAILLVFAFIVAIVNDSNDTDSSTNYNYTASTDTSTDNVSLEDLQNLQQNLRNLYQLNSTIDSINTQLDREKKKTKKFAWRKRR